MAGRGPWRCSRCSKRFPDPNAIHHHVRDVHRGVGEAVPAMRKGKRKILGREGEELMARAYDPQHPMEMGR